MALTGGAAILARLRAQRANSAQNTPEEPVVVIGYASQTGTAQDIAQSINAECNERKIKSKVLSLNDLKFENLSSSKTPIIISVVSSTGDGEPPDNSAKFFKDMRNAGHNEMKQNALRGIQYCCLGLGDSNYTSFMAIPQRFRKGFDALGAQRFYECREVDEVDGLEELVEDWIEGLWEPLKATLHQLKSGNVPEKAKSSLEGRKSVGLSSELSRSLDLTDVSDSLQDFKLPPDLEMQGVPAMPVCSIRAILTEKSQSSAEGVDGDEMSHRFVAPVVSGQKLTAEWSDREVYEMIFDLEGSDLVFSPGDSLDVLPQNDPTLITALLERLGLDGAQYLTLEPVEGIETTLPHIHPETTLQECFLEKLDVSSVLKKTVLRFLAQYCRDPAEAERLKFLVSKSGREGYHKFIVSAKASLMDVLNCFPSCQPPLAGLLELLPPLMPRLYSIACSSKVAGRRARVAFSLAKFRTPYGERTGVATRWLKGQIEKWQRDKQVSIPVGIRSGGSFGLPHELERPLILIGPGTGVAPFMGFLQERSALIRDWEGEVGACWLFFGCRRADEDYLFQSEIKGFNENGVIHHLHVAFSRQTDQKSYVQHLMLQHSSALYQDLFQHNGFVFVCGDGAQMAQVVHKCLIEIQIRHADCTEAEAKEKLNAKLKDQSYVKDVWS